MKKRRTRKLTLQRETLRTLRDHALGDTKVRGMLPIDPGQSYWNSCDLESLPRSVCDSCRHC